jgi:cytochrome b involved in lipid metabolism
VFDLYQKEKKEVVIFEGAVYDVKDYLGLHPGGKKKI